MDVSSTTSVTKSRVTVLVRGVVMASSVLWGGALTGGCKPTVSNGERGTNVTVTKNDPNIDTERASRVPVVLRVRFVKLVGGQKYVFDEVSVVAVLKNQSHRAFSGSLEVGHYGWEPGIPPGESTVYLEPYVHGDESRWKLLDGSAKEGVSHAQGAPPPADGRSD
jgi:hypothetical protein